MLEKPTDPEQAPPHRPEHWHPPVMRCWPYLAAPLHALVAWPQPGKLRAAYGPTSSGRDGGTPALPKEGRGTRVQARRWSSAALTSVAPARTARTGQSQGGAPAVIVQRQVAETLLPKPGQGVKATRASAVAELKEGRTLAKVGETLGGLSAARVDQILKAGNKK